MFQSFTAYRSAENRIWLEPRRYAEADCGGTSRSRQHDLQRIKRSRWEWLDGATWLTEDRYNPDGAERRYRENLAAKGAPLKIGNDRELADYLERKVIEEDRSPAAALADIELEGRTFKTSICVSTFYSYIEKGVFLNLTNKDLPEKPNRKRPYHRVKTTKRAPRGESIEKNARK